LFLVCLAPLLGLGGSYIPAINIFYFIHVHNKMNIRKIDFCLECADSHKYTATNFPLIALPLTLDNHK
uniref:Uncharacterized protein n=1 Tax=Xenopus tropicalis TaxID=8364 RepID=A0A6I8QL85_XENTR